MAERLGIMCPLTDAERSSREMLAAARAAGFTGVQIRVPWAKVGDDYLRALPRWVEAEGLRTDVLGAYVNCAVPENVLMDCRREDVPRVLDLAGKMGTRYVIAWTGGYGKGLRSADPRNWTPAAEDSICSFLDGYVKRLEAAGQTMALESMYTLACPDASSLAQVLNRLPRCVGAVLDPPNLTPLARYAERDKVLEEMVHTLRGRVAVVHFKDIRMQGGGGGYDFPGPMQGEMNYPLFLNLVKSLPGAPPLVAEHLKPDEFETSRRHLLELMERSGA